MSISFKPKDNLKPTDFCAAFVHQDSYVQLLELCNSKFNLHLLSPEKREVALRKSTYMLVTDNHSSIKKIKIGANVSIKLDELVYCKPLKIIVARVYLRKNYTSAKIPHIIVAKDPDLPNEVAYGVLDGSYEHMGDCYRQQLYEQFQIKGRLGIMSGSIEELNKPAKTQTQQLPSLPPQLPSLPPQLPSLPPQLPSLPPQLPPLPPQLPPQEEEPNTMTITLQPKTGNRGVVSCSNRVSSGGGGARGKKIQYRIDYDDQGGLWVTNTRTMKRYPLLKTNTGNFYFNVVGGNGKQQRRTLSQNLVDKYIAAGNRGSGGPTPTDVAICQDGHDKGKRYNLLMG